MKLVRFRLRPASPWISPWQADTLMGLLCCVHARKHGRNAMYAEIQAPALAGNPPFIISDAFPGELLPLPVSVRLLPWQPHERKAVKAACFLTRVAFDKIRAGQSITVADLQGESSFLHKSDRWRNTLSRASNTTGESGNLFSSSETSLGKDVLENCLSIYARVEERMIELLCELLRELSEIGFGADARVGRGQFDLVGPPDDASWLDAAGAAPGGCVSLSTFQPDQFDPVAGYWESFVKYGRLAPDFGIDDVFKNPLLMLRSGATFETEQVVQRLGRVIPMDELLPDHVTRKLESDGVQIVHLAYGLAVPFPAPLGAT